MPTDIILYTRDTCSACTASKRLLKEHGLTWTEIQVDTDISVEDLKAKYPGAKQLPVVVVDGRFVGSKEALVNVISKGGLNV